MHCIRSSQAELDMNQIFYRKYLKDFFYHKCLTHVFVIKINTLVNHKLSTSIFKGKSTIKKNPNINLKIIFIVIYTYNYEIKIIKESSFLKIFI